MLTPASCEYCYNMQDASACMILLYGNLLRHQHKIMLLVVWMVFVIIADDSIFQFPSFRLTGK